ncbi:group I truncated hemoglobin [Arsukibacterium indicum]|uniref:Group 1 truncated hemoglobin n=1 Tax=Arsukibacterium indicum TaxID=2848612 RepID=A0ABS6MJN8_9GAMM|nr:group 1 truncated hemoglobin [Arsukibacterium indicum]MBV2129037.1 group 1 truncated hemoglobin [Arsukibacterium indicum]
MVIRGGLIAACLLILLGCSSATQTTLYQRLGAEQGIAAIVDGLLYEIEHDERIVHHFADSDIGRFRAMLSEQLCDLTGGPCQYSGSSMQESHTGFNITLADYDALVEGLIKVMQRQQISIADQNALLALLAPMYKDISYR